MDQTSWIRGTKSILAGLIYVAAGSAAFFGAQSYTIGTPLRMGPGFFPAMMGAILVVLGVGSVIVGLREKTPNPIVAIKLEPLILIFTGAVSFALLIERAGLVVATAALVFLSCFRRLLKNPLEVVIVFLVLATFSVLVFIHGLGMQMNAFWWQQ
jgi:hypothetical protein